MAFSVQGGDTQDQNLLQFFLNVVEFGMNVQQAAEAHNITSYQMQSSFGAHQSEPGRLAVTRQIPPYTRDRLKAMGYEVEVVDRTYSPITAILIDPEQGTLPGWRQRLRRRLRHRLVGARRGHVPVLSSVTRAAARHSTNTHRNNA
jgi:gamma-glutamyltranspeptidase/glutathione hydrolase